jgi:predicted RNA binding protein YcfA (HicA-like mRNA interferase family)
MPSRAVTTSELVKVLRELGFAETVKLGAHTVFRHRNKQASVTIPTGRPYVPMVHLRAIQETMSNYDIISRTDFEKRLNIGSLSRYT